MLSEPVVCGEFVGEDSGHCGGQIEHLCLAPRRGFRSDKAIHEEAAEFRCEDQELANGFRRQAGVLEPFCRTLLGYDRQYLWREQLLLAEPCSGGRREKYGGLESGDVSEVVDQGCDHGGRFSAEGRGGLEPERFAGEKFFDEEEINHHVGEWILERTGLR